jgi:hypothetical protein
MSGLVNGGRGRASHAETMRGSGLTPASARISGRLVIGINKSMRMILQRLTKSYRNDGKKYRGILTVLNNGSFLQIELIQYQFAMGVVKPSLADYYRYIGQGAA